MIVYLHSEWKVYSVYHQTQPLKYSFLEELLSSIAYNWKTGGLSLADVGFLHVIYLYPRASWALSLTKLILLKLHANSSISVCSSYRFGKGHICPVN